MKKIVFAIIFLSGIGSAFAESSGTVDKRLMQAESVVASVVSETEGLQGFDDVDAFKTMLTTNNLFRFLLVMDSQLPDVTRIGEYVLLLNEMHSMNQKLDTIAVALQEGNLQQAKRLHKGAI